MNKIITWFKNVFISVGKWFVRVGKNIASFVVKITFSIGRYFKNFFLRFKNGGWRTKVNHFVMGFGQFSLKRPGKGIIYLLTQIAYLIFMFIPSGGLHWLIKLTTLGTVETTFIDECTLIPSVPVAECPVDDLIKVPIFGDDSMLIMLFGIATIIITFIVFIIYNLQIKGINNDEKAYEEALLAHKQTLEVDSEAKFVNPIPTFLEDLKSLFNKRFHFTTLAIPTITITMFTILPLLFMILLAFTNYNYKNGPPNSLFQWVGLETFKQLFSTSGASASFGEAFFSILSWTMIWAVAATFSNYVLGLILAMIINRRSIRVKKLWRTIFVISIAVPQFVTLLLMRNLLDYNGPLNATLIELGLISNKLPFLTDMKWARITVILVNIWVGVPYTMLITSGILMNIPSDLYESARIDGAGPVKQFAKITLPYMLFVTGPYLITQFIGNINNFNVIFFLTGGGPSAGQVGISYGRTDILITWLYSLTISSAQQEYAIGSALGIFIFIISVTITLTLYSRSSAAKSEGDFA